MASHHHYHHHSTAAATNPTPISAVCHCYSCYPTPLPAPYHHPPRPNPPHPAPSYTPYPSPLSHLCSSHFTPPSTPYNPHTQCQCEKSLHQNHHYYEEVNHQVNVTSLLRRIAALESSLKRSSPRSRQSVRDAAARTIQTHFRAFLARRSRTLGQLKQLASIKTTLNFLKSSVSGKTRFDVEAVSYKAMDLLVRLDSIQGVDPLIRDGKRSVSNELSRFMKAINGVSVFSSRIVKKNVSYGNKASDHKMEYGTHLNEAIDKFVASVNESEGEDEEELQDPRFEKSGVLRYRDQGGIKTKQKKSVRFAENASGQESFDAEMELMKNLSKRVEKIGSLSKDADEEDGGGSTGSSDNCERDVGDEHEAEKESFLFSAPMPVKMEARAKGVKIHGN